MMIKHLQLQPESTPPDISYLKPFRSVVIIEEIVTPEWQDQISCWMVKSGCLYMMAWGDKCSAWDDSVDHANLEEYDYGDIPEDKFVMTSWHENETLKDVFWFSKHNAIHPNVKIENTLLLHISNCNKEKELLNEYAETEHI